MDFSQTPPQPLSNFTLSSLEGCASICDNSGKLLFYTNGLVVNNRKNLAMLNGSDLKGDFSSTNNALIVPQPGNDSIYYLFTVGAQNQPDKGFRYSIINIKGDGGYGEVTQKNVLIDANASEKLGAVKHCNKKDVWVTIHKDNSDEYDSYLVTAAGLSASPVASHTGFFPANPIGTLKFAPNGTKLAAVYSFDTDTVELMRFDNTTGTLSNPVKFQPEFIPITDESYIRAYGAEFSPNSNLLYISANNSSTETSKLYQFDVTAINAGSIMASKQVISVNNPWYGGGLQIGPDQKIYMSMYKDSSLSVIEDPDVAGPGCNFVYNKIYMAQYHSSPMQFNFPTFIQSYFDPKSNPCDFDRSGNCADLDVTFTISRTTGIDSVKWDFGDGQNSTLLAPTHHFATGGFYSVNLIVYKPADCSGLISESILHKIWIAASANFLGADTGSCAAPTILIGVDDIEGASYLWNNGVADSKITTTDFGKYWLTIQQGGCSITDTINITEKPKPLVNIGKDTSVCIYAPIRLSAGNPTASAYVWSTGETTPTIQINKAGEYSVAVTGNSCVVSDTVEVAWGDCEISIPNTFTPDGNGLNDVFGVAGGFASYGFYMQLFDRYGH
ncbi:MAG TPA: PKD domain-containing protein, partial [Ferruginibacter sp.]|nr:PKD domain-containing protein [Ferruginibacter sp.]